MANVPRMTEPALRQLYNRANPLKPSVFMPLPPEVLRAMRLAMREAFKRGYDAAERQRR